MSGDAGAPAGGRSQPGQPPMGHGEDAATLEAFFDLSSPWTYLGFDGCRRMAGELGIPVRWRPILVGGVFNSVNPSVYEWRANPIPAKQLYIEKDLQDWAELYGLKIKFPPTVFPVNSVKAMRGCIFLEQQRRLEDFATAVFEAYWTRDEDISRDDVLAGIVAALGLDPDAFFAGIAEPAVKDALRSNTAELVARGGFGSPTFFVNGDDMYFGNDRLELVHRALTKAVAPARSTGNAIPARPIGGSPAGGLV